jgi:hypothetical protein
MVQLKKPTPHVKIGFIGKGSTDYRPAINLSTEEVDASLKEYVQAVKEIQTADPNVKWRSLGKIQMKAGTGVLTEMTQPTAWGEKKVLQAFFVDRGIAYILTASVLKEDLASLQSAIFQSFQSLSLLEDPWQPLADLFSTLGKGDAEAEWKALQERVAHHTEYGPYWQFLALQEGRRKIYGEKL